MSPLIALSPDGYERLMTMIRTLEQSGRTAIIQPVKANEHARVTVASCYQLRQLLREIVLISDSCESSDDSNTIA